MANAHVWGPSDHEDSARIRAWLNELENRVSVPVVSVAVTNPVGFVNGSTIAGTFQGTSTAGPGNRGQGLYVQMADAAGVVNKVVSGAVTQGGLIKVTCAGHTFLTGDAIAIYGVTGTVEANGAWTVTVVDANTFTLNGSTFTNAYISGGTATNRPAYYGVISAVTINQPRGGLTGTAAAGDDTACFVGFNNGSAKGTDAYYLGRNANIAGSEWTTAFTCDANADYGIRLNGTFAAYGLDFSAGAFTLGAIRLANNVPTTGRNAANSADVELFRITTGNALRLGSGAGSSTTVLSDPTTFAWSTSWADSVHLNFGTSTGSEIGTTASQKIGFWGVTPIVRPAGWTVATGTPQRTTFATSTVTLAQLAGVVMALEQDLIAAGLIGA